MSKKKIGARKVVALNTKKCVNAMGKNAENPSKVAALMALMDQHQIVSLELEERDFKIKLQKAGGVALNVAASSVMSPSVVVPSAAAPATSPAPAATVDEAHLTPIKSPIVGTFYGAPSPDAAPFVQVGDKVTAATIVCIIEAMKIMNEIKAEFGGTIEKILVENGDPIEYGQPLFLVRK